MNNNLHAVIYRILRGCSRAAIGTLVVAILLLNLREATAASQNPANSAENRSLSRPLWGSLSPGLHQVGFRSIFRFDASRTWKETRDYAGAFSPDLNGRPVQLNVWYPASTNALGKRMTFEDYTDQTAPKAFSVLNSIMQNRNWQNAKSSVPSAQLSALLSTPVNSYAEAPEAVGRFPTVLYFGGLNGEINSDFILAEFLASHGFVVASISLLGLTEQQSEQGKTPSDLDAIVRDMEFAAAILSDSMNADRTKLAVIGHSVGAIEAAIFGLRNGNVSAVIALDGTYGFKGSAGHLTNSYGYGPQKMRCAILDLRRAQGEQEANLDLSPVLSFRYADRRLVTLTGMHHSDFTSFAMIASNFQVPMEPKYVNTGWDRETARRGYEGACRMILEFLLEKVDTERQAAERFRQIVQSADVATFRHLDAVFAPPSPQETVAMAKERDLDAIKTLCIMSCPEQTVSACVDINAFNSYGYSLLGQRQAKNALVVFQIAAWAHPTSANALDSLADAYLAVGDKEKARTAIQRAIEIAAADASIRNESKDSFVTEEKRRLEQLK